jgi:hypothetical protein
LERSIHHLSSRTTTYLVLTLLLSACGAPKNGSSSSGALPVPGTCASGPTSASINIFNENPRTSSGNSALPFNSTLDSSMTLPGTITGLSGNCLLQSARYSITGDSFYPGNVAKISGGAQTYGPASPEFQQLNGFFYATALKVLVVDTLGASLSGRISIDAHCNQQDNAYFSPTSKALCFGWHDAGGGKKVWASDDADVVIHESGHTVNHSLASTSIMNSTTEAGSIDESLADYWALTVMSDAQLSEWFLGSIGAAYVRDATASHSYPASLNYEVHDDSRLLTEVLWDLRAAGNLGKSDTDKLVKRALQLLPATTRFADFYEAFYDASGPAFLNLDSTKRSLIVTKFTNKGFHRADSAASLRLSTTSAQVRVIDDHSYSFLSGGNCNGVLDVGESALVLVNLENPGASAMGNGVVTLGSAPAGTSVPSGGEVGEYFRLKAASDFVASLPAAGSSRDDATMMASFVVHANTAGAKNFSMTYRPMYSDPTGALPANPDVTISFSVNVGSAATSSSCTNNALWP